MGKVKSSILGFVIGDALGVPVEFKDRNYLKTYPVKKMFEYGSHNVPKGTWSDDTSMLLATMDSIIENDGINYDDIMIRFYNWYMNAEYTATNEVFDIGITTRNALQKYKDGIEPLKCGLNGYYENGNGSLMRILPIVFYSFKNNLNFCEEKILIDNVSSLTHAHEISKLGCKIYSDYVKNILSGYDKIESIELLPIDEYKKYYSKESLSLYLNIINGNIIKFKEENIKSSGFIVHSLEAVVWVIIHSNSFESALLKAVNLGEDTDTIGALTGSIAALIYDYESIPDEWLNDLQNKEYLNELANRFENYLSENKIEKYTKYCI